MIPAHDSPLAALAFSPNGTKVATASEKGTVIRVFHVSLIIYITLIIFSKNLNILLKMFYISKGS